MDDKLLAYQQPHINTCRDSLIREKYVPTYLPNFSYWDFMKGNHMSQHIHQHQLLKRVEAKATNQKSFYTGKPCKHGHYALRSTATGACRTCMKSFSLAEYAANKVKPEYKQHQKEKLKKYYEENKQKFLDKANQNYEDNPHKFTTSRLKVEGKEKSIPVWYESEEQAIALVYKKCRELNKRYGTRLEVDHIIPIHSDTVSGLHCFANLQILDKSLNISKFTSYTKDW